MNISENCRTCAFTFCKSDREYCPNHISLHDKLVIDKRMKDIAYKQKYNLGGDQHVITRHIQTDGPAETNQL